MAVGPYATSNQAVNYTAQGAIGKHLIVQFGTNDKTVTLTSSQVNPCIGVTSDIDVLDGEPCDVFRDGIARVIYGTTVGKGAVLTAGAGGRAFPTFTQGDRYLGIAEVSGVAGDIGSVLICPGIV